MLKHYLKIALRNLAKQKGLAFINVFGLSLGLACFILFLLYSVNEFNFDRFHSNASNIYRVYRWVEAYGKDPSGGDIYLPMPLGPALKEEFADVENYVRFQESWGQSFIRFDGKVTREAISFADPDFFSVFSFPIKTGTQDALEGLRSIVITRETANKLFGHDQVIGKTVEIKLEQTFEPFVITAVAENIPANSSITFTLLANFEFLATTNSGKRSLNNWFRSSYPTYLVLKPGSSLPFDANRLASFRSKYYPDEDARERADGWKGRGPRVKYKLQNLLNIHTNTQVWGGNIASVEPKTIWILLAIAAGVLLIACINFTTLAIGRSAGRAKEVGIRKVIGSKKKDLLFQFMTEAFLLTLISTLAGLAIARFLLPWFNQLSGRELEFSFHYYPEMIWLLAMVILVVAVLTGSYPSLVLSRFQPIEVLKRKMKVGGSNFFTKSLVTLQFVVSVGLIISTIIIVSQLKFMRTKNPGFSKENVVVVDAEGTDAKTIYPLFKRQATSLTSVKGVTGSELALGEGTGWSRSGFRYQGQLKEVYEYFVDADYLPVMGMQLIAGRNFDARKPSDTASVVINEAMVKDFGWTNESAIGQRLTGYMENLAPEVIGVVKNFHFRPFKEEVMPQMFHQFSSYVPFKFFVRIEKGDPSSTLASLRQAWRAIEPNLPFKYSFLDEDLNKFYHAEERWSTIVGWAGGISVFLACLGLLGLAALAAVNRTKEIGIRKVLGASVSAIVALLSKDFLKLVIIAFIIASPLAWYFMNQWLQDFAYRISISGWTFVIAGVLAIAIALLTISFQAVKAALSNPVKNLRSE